MKITTKGRYALRAVVNMALRDDDKPTSIKVITEQEKLSPIFLEQIFTKLKKAGIINSIRGAYGGFVLAKDAGDISVRDILEAVDEGLLLTPCSNGSSDLGDACRKDEGCSCSDFWIDANLHLNDYFSGISIADILKKYGA